LFLSALVSVGTGGILVRCFIFNPRLAFAIARGLLAGTSLVSSSPRSSA
jgi:hypothetical protein